MSWFESKLGNQFRTGFKLGLEIGRESKIEIRDLIMGDFRFGLFSIIDFQNMAFIFEKLEVYQKAVTFSENIGNFTEGFDAKSA